jgi:hypothetical protein
MITNVHTPPGYIAQFEIEGFSSSQEKCPITNIQIYDATCTDPYDES